MDSVDLGSPAQEMPPVTNGQFPPQDQQPCSKLAADLLSMFEEQRNTDVLVQTDCEEIGAHK